MGQLWYQNSVVAEDGYKGYFVNYKYLWCEKNWSTFERESTLTNKLRMIENQ